MKILSHVIKKNTSFWFAPDCLFSTTYSALLYIPHEIPNTGQEPLSCQCLVADNLLFGKTYLSLPCSWLYCKDEHFLIVLEKVTSSKNHTVAGYLLPWGVTFCWLWLNCLVLCADLMSVFCILASSSLLPGLNKHCSVPFAVRAFILFLFAVKKEFQIKTWEENESLMLWWFLSNH